MTDPLQESSERIVESNRFRSLDDYVSYEFHRATYVWAASMAHDLDVVDYGCGSGYGTAMIAQRARIVFGYDVSEAAIEFARANHAAPNLQYGSIGSHLPLSRDQADMVVSFQVIEHVDPEPYLREVTRVLRPGGMALFATPNRSHRLFAWQRPWNRWHHTEYDPEGFAALLNSHFSSVALFELTDRAGLGDILKRRWRRARLVSVPLTLPFIPDAARRTFLGVLSAASRRAATAPSGFPETDIRVVPLTGQGCEILAVARP